MTGIEIALAGVAVWIIERSTSSDGKVIEKKNLLTSDITESLVWELYDDRFIAESINFDIDDWRWIKAIAIIESALGLAPTVARGLQNPRDVAGSVSADGKSWGIMQVTLKTAQGDLDLSATPEKLNNARYSIALGSEYFSRQIQAFFPSLEFAVKAYNQGPGATRREKNKEIIGSAGAYYAKWVDAYRLTVAH